MGGDEVSDRAGEANCARAARAAGKSDAVARSGASGPTHQAATAGGHGEGCPKPQRKLVGNQENQASGAAASTASAATAASASFSARPRRRSSGASGDAVTAHETPAGYLGVDQYLGGNEQDACAAFAARAARAAHAPRSSSGAISAVSSSGSRDAADAADEQCPESCWIQADLLGKLWVDQAALGAESAGSAGASYRAHARDACGTRQAPGSATVVQAVVEGARVAGRSDDAVAARACSAAAAAAAAARSHRPSR